MEAPRGDDSTTVDADSAIAVRGRRVTEPSARGLLTAATPPAIAWETAAETIVARGTTATIEADGSDRFATVRSRAESLFDRCDPPDSLPQPARPRLYGGFTFTNRGGTNGPWRDFSPAWFVLPSVQLVGTGGEWWVTVTASGPDADRRADDALTTWVDRLSTLSAGSTGPLPGIRSFDRVPSRGGWNNQVREALARIETGELEKVVLAQSLNATLSNEFHVVDALDRLGEAYPDCFRFAVAPTAESTFFGATPERLVTRRGRTIETEALAGSTGRGDTPAEDEWLAEELRESEKDGHEHQLVVDAICDQLDPIAGNVSTGPLTVRRLATVQHLRTPITAELHTDDHVLSLVEALHPTPTVGGLPPERALETIRETEAFDRGWYAGPIGWFDNTGDGEFAVAIRSALARGESRRDDENQDGAGSKVEDDVTCFAGAGIVADSDPDREWDEVQLKYRPIVDALE